MNRIVKFAAASALMAGISFAALAASLACADAAPRGGTMVYGRYADSLFLDSVLNDANVDIWILSNLYDTDFRNT